ncbi:FadR/GntR family transcriptional regulator [Enterovirga aerilata]|uniref:FadR family transcriptional regulator n=1 Tax=Enterovirga aerilata TaxID=2730920 RepID=A0A849I933_9HYPH|nr:FadR/GntR family transcriptional regulator [Enterovirga sp. DB1703]NNM72919.1 FadR family transcriptional regulator [Enterovirga sp. DB1703]
MQPAIGTRPGSKPGKIGRVVATLGGGIARGEFPPGAPLPPEHDLETRYGASRGVVREAVKILATKGLVTVRPRYGTHVLPRRDWSLLDRDVLQWIRAGGIDRELLVALDETRRIIEPGAAALAAERAGPEDKARIRAAYLRMEETVAEHEAAIEADKAFHLAILDATHNPVLGSFRTGIDAILSAVFDVAAPLLEGNLPNHLAVLEAIEAGEPERAREWMNRLLNRTRDALAAGEQAGESAAA